MPTPNLNLPLIDRNMFADVPRDMNALAYAIDDSVRPNGKIALRQDLQSLQQTLNNHINDNVKHVTKPERDGWNKAVADLGNKDELLTQNKFNLVLAINELFQSASDVKKNVAQAITDKGVQTSPDANGAQMAANIRAIKTGSLTATGTMIVPPIAPGQLILVETTPMDFTPIYAYSSIIGSVRINGTVVPNTGVTGRVSCTNIGFKNLGGKIALSFQLVNNGTATSPQTTATWFASE